MSADQTRFPHDPAARARAAMPADFVRHHDLLVYGEEDPGDPVLELEFLAAAFRGHAARPVHDVLDYACGNGRYLVALAGAGYRVTGCDQQAGLLAQCLARMEQAGVSGLLANGGLESLGAGARFDAVLVMGDVLGELGDADFARCLAAARDRLRPGGLLVLDQRNLLADWDLLERKRRYDRSSGDARLWFTETADLDAFGGWFTHNVSVVLEEKGGKRFFDRVRRLRIRTTRETIRDLADAGYQDVMATSGFEFPGPADPNAERVQFLARAPY